MQKFVMVLIFSEFEPIAHHRKYDFLRETDT